MTPPRSRLSLASFFAELFRPMMLRNRPTYLHGQYKTAIGWLAKVLGRPPELADLNRITLESALEQMAKAGIAGLTLRSYRKRWVKLWRYAAQLGWLPPASTPPLPRPVPVFRPWTCPEPPDGSLLAFYRRSFRPELRQQLSARELARYDCAINHFHDFVGRLIALEEVTPDLLDEFRTWCDGLTMSPENRTGLRGALRRVMRAADPPRFPKRDGCDPRAAVGSQERAERDLKTHGQRASRRLPELVGEPGTCVHFVATVYRPQAIPHCSDSHWQNVQCLLRKLRLCFGRDLRIDELSRETIAEFRAFLIESGNAKLTAKHTIGRLLTIWRFGEEQGQAPPVPRFRPERLKREQPDAWTQEEAARVIDATARLTKPPIGGIPADKFWRAILLVGWWTALRRGAIVRIRVEDVDLANGFLYIPAAHMKAGVGKRFKLGADAIAAIQDILQPERERLFPVDPASGLLSDHFNAILQLAGVEKGNRLPNSCFHKWRRTVATLTALRAGMAAATALLAHSGPGVTVARYIDPSFLATNDSTTWLPSLGELAQRQKGGK